MNILEIVPRFHPVIGGTETIVKLISEELARRGHKVIVYTSDILDDCHRQKEKSLELNSVKVYYLKNLSNKLAWYKFFFTPSIFHQFRKELKKFDIIHLHNFRTFQNIIAYHYSRKYKVPYILQAHGNLPRIMPQKSLKWLYDFFFGYRLLRDAKKVIALNQKEVEQYKSMGVPEENIEIIPNGINLSEYNDLPLKGSFRKKFKIGDNDRIILFLGRINRIKGVDILIMAFTQIIEKLDDVKLTIVGPDDGNLSELQNLVKDLGVEKKVTFTGPLYGVKKLEAYVDADVFVLPSRYDTFPMSVLEAYSCGKPIIASNVGGMKDLVIDGVTGLLFATENTRQLTGALFSMLEDNTRAEKMGLKGKQFIKENFTIENILDRLELIYKENSNRAQQVKH